MTSKLKPRHRTVPPKQPDAEPVCLLDAEWAKRRAEPPDAFLASARSQRTLADGAEFRFEAVDGLWERVSTFVDEERECCPFFAFEEWEDGGEVVLRITRPENAR
ncbi:MAG: hypothetical protein WEE64_05130 [Dehalococcoidia bacterium]